MKCTEEWQKWEPHGSQTEHKDPWQDFQDSDPQKQWDLKFIRDWIAENKKTAFGRDGSVLADPRISTDDLLS